MPPRKRFSGSAMCALLEKHGFDMVRQKGSHQVMRKDLKGSSVTVPVPMHKDLKPGTLASIIRQSVLSKRVFQ
jgi:predicted RNA binding protein YcfA (HicA-like mRNA interferase family)